MTCICLHWIEGKVQAFLEIVSEPTEVHPFRFFLRSLYWEQLFPSDRIILPNHWSHNIHSWKTYHVIAYRKIYFDIKLSKSFHDGHLLIPRSLWILRFVDYQKTSMFCNIKRVLANIGTLFYKQFWSDERFWYWNIISYHKPNKI